MDVVIPERPDQLPRVRADAGAVAAGWLSVLLMGPLGVILMWAVSANESAYRRFQLAQAAITVSAITGVAIAGGAAGVGLVAALALAGLAEGTALGVGIGTIWLTAFAAGVATTAASAIGALRMFQGRDLVVPGIGRRVFDRWFRGKPQEVLLEAPLPTDLPAGPYASPSELPSRQGDRATALFGHWCTWMLPGILPLVVLGLQPKASPHLRFHLAQTGLAQLALLGVASAAGLGAVGVGVPLVLADTAVGLPTLVGLEIAVMLPALALLGLPVLATVLALAGRDLVVPGLGPWLFRRMFAGSPAAVPELAYDPIPEPSLESQLAAVRAKVRARQ